jgi:flavin reductase (DIM6/NTAB) family NADH-FMN oxidoreductase RutF
VSPSGEHDAYDRLRRRVLWAMPTGLYLIGSAAQNPARANLMTANLVVQVSLEPKLVAVALEETSLTLSLVREGRAFSVNLLARSDRAVVRHFVKPVTEIERDEAGAIVALGAEAVTTAATGAPILQRAAAWLDCELRAEHALGSHSLCIGEVVAVGGPEAEVGEVLRMEDTRMNYGG